MKSDSPFVTLTAVLFFLFASIDIVLAQPGCLIKLKNGREIKSAHCYEAGDQVFFNRFGGYVAVSKSEVAEVASANVPVGTTAAPSSEDHSAAPRAEAAKTGSKSTRPEPTEKERLNEEIKKKESALSLTRRYQMIYCGQADESAASVSPAPNIPKANQVTVSEKTAQAFQKHVQSKVQAFKANSSCDFYNKEVLQKEQEIEQLKQKRDSL